MTLELLFFQFPLKVRFVHLDPNMLFQFNEGRLTTPQHTDMVYQQLSTLQIGSGCLQEHGEG